MSLRVVLKCDTYICESDLWLSFGSYKETLENLLEEAHQKGWSAHGSPSKIEARCPRCQRGEV
jgi:hypothetical protein